MLVERPAEFVSRIRNPQPDDWVSWSPDGERDRRGGGPPRAPARTYQDLLANPHDETLFEHYLTARLARVGLDGWTVAILVATPRCGTGCSCWRLGPDLALVFDWWWKTRNTRSWSVAPARPGAEPRLLVDRSWEDRYDDPGDPVTVTDRRGRRVLFRVDGGRALLLAGDGASPEGDCCSPAASRSTSHPTTTPATCAPVSCSR